MYDRREYLGKAGGVTGTIQRNHIRAVHVLRLHRAIHIDIDIDIFGFIVS